ncbi:MAG TPA: helix-turn-helix transcriptional regulator [Ktedonobacterales bacterium]|jgi:transcriptional regulator with XRE-family HTH domain|nr:helix-turn-helix transcriptional regulator [Ktedonobacterales bacterium]
MASIEERFGQRVRDLRQERHWSQEELAYRSGLHRTYIGSLERGERNVSLRAIQMIADAFSLSVHDLMAL